MQHPISAPSGVSQLSFARLIEAARAIAARGDGEQLLGPLADLHRETADALEAFLATKARFHRAANQSRSLDAPLIYVEMAVAWSKLAAVALCHYYQYVTQGGVIQPKYDLPWHKVARATEGLFSILDGVDIAVLLTERRAQGQSEDSAAELHLAARILREPGIADLFADEVEVTYAAAR